MDVRNSTSKEPFNMFFRTKMAASVIGSSWFLFWGTSISLAVLINLVARYIFSHRTKNEDRVEKDLQSSEPVTQPDYMKKSRYDTFDDGEKDLTPTFSFKFQYQLPDLSKETVPPEPVTLVTKEESSPVVTEAPIAASIHTCTVVTEASVVATSVQEDPVVAEAPIIATSIHQYKFLTEKDFSGFIQQPQTMKVCIQESLMQPEPEEHLQDEERRTDAVFDSGFLSVKDFQEPVAHSSHVRRKSNSSSNAFMPVNEVDELESTISDKHKPLEKRRGTTSPSNLSTDTKEVSGRASFLSSEFSGFGSDSESSISDGYSVKELAVDYDSDCLLSENNFARHEHGSDIADVSVTLTNLEGRLVEEIQNFEEAKLHLQSVRDSIMASFETESQLFSNSVRTDSARHLDDIWSENNSPRIHFEEQEFSDEEDLKEVRGVEETNLESLSSLHVMDAESSDDEFYSNKKAVSAKAALHNSSESSNGRNDNLDGSSCTEYTEVVSDDKNISETSKVELVHTNDHHRNLEPSFNGKEKLEYDKENDEENKWKDLTEEEEDELESLWEHQDLIEQLKAELKKVRAIGLPTIFEESESPKEMEDLKPWKIDARFLREDPMDELHKFYKSYRERMRKFDILCYQKMYAIDFLQLKDPLQSMGSQKQPILPTVTSILSQNFRTSRRKSSEDPTERFLKELRCDLETVYVGQMCLSWEFLRWQYEQARELPESDPYRTNQYNQVAGEFQQFQVILQRFIENEAFQGPRLPNYVNNRCVPRNLLQVPVTKEDCLKERLEEQRKGNYAITSEELEDIMEESIRVFWEFVKADKEETPALLKGLMSSQAELQEPSDRELMMRIQVTLQKKEKRLKDLLKTGNCLVKKFKKPKEDRSNQDLFFSQVDMRLISRVLKMQRITSDQLQWCHAKLDKIRLKDRKIHREPSFLLFPC